MEGTSYAFLVFSLCLSEYLIFSHCTLIFSHVIFRHGDRSPTKTFPSDPYNETSWFNGYGQLSKKGMDQAYGLGQFLRTRYVTDTYPAFLSDSYARKEIYTVSTDTDRTLSTAYCMLAGLYPVNASQSEANKWGQGGPAQALGSVWQPIPVRSLMYGIDPLLCTDVSCHEYDTHAQRIYQSNHFHRLQKENEALIDYVCEKAGWSEPSLQNAWDTFDPLFCMQQHERHLSWANETTIEGLRRLKTIKYELMFKDPAMSKLRAGTFLNELLNNTKYVIEKKMDPNRRVNFYSSHDTLLGALLYALDVWNNILPPYTSAIIFELHETTSEKYHVEIYYRNHSHLNPNGPYKLKLPKCNENCPWEQFQEIVSPMALDNFQEACANLEGLHHTSDEGLSTGGKAALVLFAIVASICVIATAFWCYQKRRNDFRYSSTDFDEPHL